MNENKKNFIKKYINQLEQELNSYNDNLAADESFLFDCIYEIKSVFASDFPKLDDNLAFNKGTAIRDAKIVLGLLNKKLIEDYVCEEKTPQSSDDCFFRNDNETPNSTCKNQPIIFISHSSSDKKYGNALRKFIIGLGVKDEQLIYTSHELNGIPMDKNIYEYLRENFNNKMFMIILWSKTYLESPACLSELGAAWVTQSDYTNIYVPDFDFGNPKYYECAVDTRKMGALLKNDENCKTKMIELKDKILKIFNLEIDEKHFMVLLDKFMESII